MIQLHTLGLQVRNALNCPHDIFSIGFHDLVLSCVLQVGIDMTGQHGILAFGTHHDSLRWKMDKWIHGMNAYQIDMILSLSVGIFIPTEEFLLYTPLNAGWLMLCPILCVYAFMPALCLRSASWLTWPVHLFPPSKIDDDNCLLEKLTFHWGFDETLNGAGVAYAGANTYSSLSRIRRDLGVTLINGLG